MDHLYSQGIIASRSSTIKESEGCRTALDPARLHVRAALEAALDKARDTSIFRWPQQGDLDPILDAVLDALTEVHDEIECSVIRLGEHNTLTIHTSTQVCDWLHDLMAARGGLGDD